MFVKLYLGPLIWNGLSDDVKLSNNVNTLKGKKRASWRYYEKRIKTSMYNRVKYHHHYPTLIMKLYLRTGI